MDVTAPTGQTAVLDVFVKHGEVLRLNGLGLVVPKDRIALKKLTSEILSILVLGYMLKFALALKQKINSHLSDRVL